jgi:hypothetical protein
MIIDDTEVVAPLIDWAGLPANWACGVRGLLRRRQRN